MVLSLPTPGGNTNIWGGKMNDWLTAQNAGIFNVLHYGAVGDGVTDDRAAVQIAEDARFAAGGGKLFFPGPDKNYLIGFRDGFYGGSTKACIFLYGDNITVECGEGATITVTDGHANGFKLFSNVPGTITPDTVDSSGEWWLDHGGYMFPSLGFDEHPLFDIDPATKGDYSLTLATPADHSNFAVGDAVWIRAGQTIDSSGQAQPDAELNEITAINTGTGELTFVRPLAKDYVQEYFPDAGLDNPTTTSSTAYPAYLGIQNVETWITRNLAFRNLNIVADPSTGAGTIIAVGSAFNFEITGCTANLVNCEFQSGGPWRGATFIGNTVNQIFDSQAGVFFASDRGCGDMTWQGNTLKATGDYVSILHVHEGTYNAVIADNEIVNPDTATDNHAIQVMGRGYDIELRNNRITHRSSATGEPIHVGGDVVGITLVGNTLIGGSSGVGASDMRILDNVGPIAVFASAVTASPQYLSFLYDYTWAHEVEVIVGQIPANCYVFYTDVFIITPFNGTSPLLYVGDDSYGGAIVSAAVMSGSAWSHPTTNRDPENGWYQNGSGAVDGMQDIIAWPQQGGSSAGRALVVIGYVSVPFVSGI